MLDKLISGGLEQVIQVYKILDAAGYKYAGWAEGVASGSAMTGQSALDYLKGSALMGAGGDACRDLASEQIDKIRTDMAKGYLEILKAAAEEGGNSTSEDISFKEVEKLHKDVFENSGLTLDNWTLNTPMELLRSKYGDEVVENAWEIVRETGGSGIDALAASSALLHMVGTASHSPDPARRDMANQWLGTVLGSSFWGTIDKFLRTMDSHVRRRELGR